MTDAVDKAQTGQDNSDENRQRKGVILFQAFILAAITLFIILTVAPQDLWFAWYILFLAPVILWVMGFIDVFDPREWLTLTFYRVMLGINIASATLWVLWMFLFQ